MNTVASSPFQLEGEFRGFFRDVFGKHRLALQVAGEEVFLKVPKPLRKALKGSLNPGEKLIASGNEVLGGGKGVGRRIVSHVRVMKNAECLSCPIRVCARKTCWRNGGKDLWKLLEQKIAAADLGGVVKLKAVDCLGECQRGPNVECAGRIHHRCAPHEAAQMLAPFLDFDSAQTLFDPTAQPMHC